MAITAAIIIVYGTFSYRENREKIFRQQIVQADSLPYYSFPRFFKGDSIQFKDFTGGYILLDIWASRSDISVASHKQLAEFHKRFSDTLEVVAASVKDNASRIREYRDLHFYPFIFVDGTAFYNQMMVPGIPSQILFNPEGKVVGIFVGYTGPARYDSLRTLIQDE